MILQNTTILSIAPGTKRASTGLICDVKHMEQAGDVKSLVESPQNSPNRMNCEVHDALDQQGCTKVLCHVPNAILEDAVWCLQEENNDKMHFSAN